MHLNKSLFLTALALVLLISEAAAFSGYYEIVNRNSGMLLDVAGLSTNNGGNVDQWIGNSGANQQWTLTSLENGYYEIVNLNSGLALEVSGSSTTNGANVDQWAWNGGNNQQWGLLPLGSGFYEITNRNSGLALDVAGQSTADGANVDQWPWNGGGNQQWLILAVGATNAISPYSGGSGVAANTFHGFNWADPNDNFIDGPLLLSGLSETDSYATVQATAAVVLGAFQSVGANTVRMPINPQTVIGSWWASYKGAIDKATSMGFKVIICPWCGQSDENGMVNDLTTYWQMWDTVVTTYNGNGNVYFEVLNEPWGYSTTDWLTVVSNWLQRYPTVAHGRVLAGGTGYDQNVPAVASSGIAAGCLFSVHDYGFWNSGDTSDSDWYNSLSGEVGSYAGRTVLTEFGAGMTDGLNYAGGDQSNNFTASMIGFCNYCCSNQIGAVYWPGLRDGDSYSMFDRNANTTELSLNSPSGKALVQYAWSGFTGIGTYQVVNGYSGLALEVAGSSTADGANVDQWLYDGGPNQQWTLKSLGNGYYEISNQNSGLALEVASSSTGNGGNVDQWSYSGGNNQQWGVSSLGDGFFEITNRNSGLALEDEGWSTNDGGNVDQWMYDDGANQVWTFAGANLDIASLVVDPPWFTPSMSVTNGTAVTVSVGVSGAAPFYLQWQTDGGSGGALTNIPGATNATLAVDTTNLSAGVVDQFDVVVTNSSQVVTSATAGLIIIYTATALLTDKGGSISPGANDISQLIGGGEAYYGDGLNYFDDNGVNHGTYAGQTFTTGTNASGYNLASVAIDTGGGSDNLTTTPQGYDLFIFSITNGDATLIAQFSTNNFAFIFGDWLQWSGFSVPLKANTVYAYAFGREAGVANSYAALNTSPTNTDLYSGGQICLIPSGGGALTYGTSGNSDAVFDLGLSPMPQKVTLEIQSVGGGQLELQWPSGVLLQATNLLGPWTTNAAVTSPYDVTPSAAQMFYKVL
jgi:endoglucanase